MHDVGKVTTPDRILLKPGALESDELAVMRQHTVTGRDILDRARVIAEGSIYLELGAQIAFNHHEWWDGGGYPSGIHGAAIPLAARIVSVADVFDALTHERPYKKAWALDDALAYIRSASGTQFDPAVVDAFFALIGDDDGVRYLTLA
jgi:HD-GYP domain-containing protein (c-di-GMP phosphodiesterase class II)